MTPPSRAFVLGLADRHGHLDASALYDLGVAVGLSETSIRLTTRRLRDAGLLDTAGRGRKATITLTDAGLADRSPDLGWVALAYRLDSGEAPWDGHWHLASFAIAEAQRSARDALRNYLIELLGAPVGNGLYVSHYDWKPWVDAKATRLEVSDSVTTLSTDDLEVGRQRDPRAVAARLWKMDELDAEAAAFVDRWAPVASRPPDDPVDAARAIFAASVHFEDLTRRDPLLPSELAPTSWRGRDVREVYRTLAETVSERHPAIGQANVFTAFLSVIDETASMTEEAFAHWLWKTTRPT